MLISGLAEIISLASVMPFIMVLTKPDNVKTIPYLKSIFLFFNIEGSNEIFITVTIIFAFTIILAAIIRVINLWLNTRLSASIGTEVTNKLYKIVLNEPYSLHVKRNSNSVINLILKDAQSASASIGYVLQLSTGLIAVLAISITIFYIDYIFAISSISLFALCYIVIAFTVRPRLTRNSSEIVKYTTRVIGVVQESIGAIRDVILSGNQSIYSSIHIKAEYNVAKSIGNSIVLGSSPKFIVEAVGLTGIAIFSLIISLQNKSNSNLLPLIGTMALAAQRILPAMQQVYYNWSGVKSVDKALDNILTLLRKDYLFSDNQVSKSLSEIKFDSKIDVDGLYFRFNERNKYIIKGINLTIKKGEIIGIMGKTGSGKSTFMDLLMGLLVPEKGSISVDGINLNQNINSNQLLSWQRSISHVPQTIFLGDCSIIENIAFGIPENEMSFKKVIECAKLARLNEFIEGLEEGYNTYVGERGIRLSGGQRQRIGIARALYKDSKILFLDEATSALDEKTESEVMEAINNVKEDITIIIIAHRLKSLSICDRVIRMDNGIVKEIVTPEEILT